ncbi:MAG TPA: phenylalanine--tRNA ligase subunit alpha [bacterium]|nr:phenylalanine--tRNA ligase subunit alpha [bacterium]
MKILLQNLKQEITEKIKLVKNEADLEHLRLEYLSRKGKFTESLKALKDVAVAERPVIGKLANEVKQEVEHLFAQTQNAFSGENNFKQSGGKNPPTGGEKIYDATLPGLKKPMGTYHPITQIIKDLNQAFQSLNFEIYEDNEITTEEQAFDNLNFPPNHPARESMDTYWIKGSEDRSGQEKLCLRPHLTGNSVNYMKIHQPPFRFVYPGRVFRSEATDAGHERCFYQYEALIVDENISFSAGKVLIQTILNKVFGKEIPVRMRAGFFPFVEPGFEIDMQCQVCGGVGCSVCKHNGWLEVMPGGAPHPNVLKAGGLDPKKWQGFYINVGLDRLVMMKYGIDDVRLMHFGDLRFLRQF